MTVILLLNMFTIAILEERKKPETKKQKGTERRNCN